MPFQPISSGGYQRGRHWSAEDLIEHHPVLVAHRLPPGEYVTENGQTLIVERFAWHPPHTELRPRFRCPQCDRGCYHLHGGGDDGLYRCRKCSALDYTSRHVGRAGERFKNRADLARYRKRVLAAVDRRLMESKR
jgi:tRNA(Ile2) C34 agmatinyltransferase TiaS